MTKRSGVLGFATLGGALLLGAALAQSPATPQPAPRSTPHLVLFVSVDQMRFDYLTRFAPLFKDGFKILLERGAVFSEAYYRHANTETGPGHSVLLSGRHASATGIIANSWYDRLRHASVNVVDDPAQAPVAGQGRAASPANFLGVTVGDLLKKASPDSRVFGVSLKDRAAVLMAGRRADGAFWYDASSGRFMTSTYYVKRAPNWLDAWNAERQADALFGKLWTRLLPDEAVYRRYAGEDAVAGEWDGKNNVFPHAIPGAAKTPVFYDEVRRTPFADELTLDVALRAMDAYGLGRGSATDLLAVGFSATDIIGHTYGADSQEILDQLLRLDGLLGRLFREADARVGPGRTLVGLGADHGSMPLVEVLKARGIDARRADPNQLEAAVQKALAERFPGASGLVANYDWPNFYLDLPAIRRQQLKLQDVEGAIEQAMLATGVVERVYTHSRLLGDPPADDPDFGLFRASFFEPRSPDVIARLKRYVYMGEHPGGTGHGTPEDYDRHVPVVFMGAGIKPGRYGSACGPEDIAPTIAELLGLDYAVEPDQRVLSEMLSN